MINIEPEHTPVRAFASITIEIDRKAFLSEHNASFHSVVNTLEKLYKEKYPDHKLDLHAFDFKG